MPVYRLSAHILSGFADIAGDHVFPEYGGCFHTILYSVPEAARGVRARLQYNARSLGCGRLRPGIPVGFSDRTAQLDARLPAIDDPGCYATAVLTPESVEAARRMTSRAFSLDAALAQLPALEERKNALSANGSATGSGRVGLSLSTFFDLYVDVARDVMAHPLLPEVLVEGTQPAVRGPGAGESVADSSTTSDSTRGSSNVRGRARPMTSSHGCRCDDPGRSPHPRSDEPQSVRAIRSIASVSSGRGSAKLNRMWPAPTSPQRRPSVMATFARSLKRCARCPSSPYPRRSSHAR